MRAHTCRCVGNSTIEFPERERGGAKRYVLASTDPEPLAYLCVVNRMGVREEISHGKVLSHEISCIIYTFFLEISYNLFLFHVPLSCRQGSGTMLSIQNPLFIAFTVSNILLTVWQFSEIVRKTGHPSKTTDIIWFQKSSHNAILVEFSYLLWMQLQMGAVLYIMCFVPLQEFSAFMDAFPKMQFLLSNLALNTAFFNNLAIFVATLLRYKVVSKPNNYNIYVFSLPLLSSVWIVWKVLGCFFLSYNGEMSSSFISMMLQ